MRTGSGRAALGVGHRPGGDLLATADELS
jgi:hypothetical protein